MNRNEETEHKEEGCPACGSKDFKTIYRTGMLVDRTEHHCNNCTHMWEERHSNPGM